MTVQVLRKGRRRLENGRKSGYKSRTVQENTMNETGDFLYVMPKVAGMLLRDLDQEWDVHAGQMERIAKPSCTPISPIGKTEENWDTHLEGCNSVGTKRGWR